jgi:hypothetical protein
MDLLSSGVILKVHWLNPVLGLHIWQVAAGRGKCAARIFMVTSILKLAIGHN